jgi:adenylate cyclase
MTRRLFAGGLVGAAAAGLILVIDALLAASGDPTRPHALETLELKTYDWRLSATARPETARRDIALVEIDEYSLQNLEAAAGRWPWPRVVHASLVDYLSRAPAKLIAYDVTFGAPDSRLGFRMGDATLSGADSDRAFAESVERAGNVLLLADATYGGEKADAPPVPATGFALDVPGILERRTLLLPYPELADAAAGFGHNFLALDADGPVRHTVPFVRSHGVAVPSLGMAAALQAAGVPPAQVTLQDEVMAIGSRRMPLTLVHTRTPDGEQTFYWRPIDFRGPALLEDLKSRPYPSYAFYDLLYSEEQLLAGEKPNVDPAVFKDKIVFVGVTASGLFDVFETPFARGKMPGIQVHAAVADDVLSDRFITAASAGTRVAIVVASALLVGLLAAALPAWWAALAAGLFVAALAAAALRLFAAGTWVNLTQPALASSLALFGGVAYQYFVEGRERRKVSRLFGRYVSKDVYEQLLANPALARLGGQRREMTVLFSDVRAFTTLTEQGEPEAIVGTLNEYFTRMVDLVFRHQGTLDKFVGDMVMALFGAPLDDPDHAEHAVQAALDMVKALGELNERWRAEGRPTLDIGIGINTGPMIAGNIGSEAIMSYTVIGDAVNLGSRLESLNKQYGTRIIISDATRRRLTGRYALRPLGEVVVKGKSQAVSIFELVGRAADSREPAAEAAATKEARV